MNKIAQTIDFHRFGLLVRKFIIENGRRFALQFGGITLAMILVFVFDTYNSYQVTSGEKLVMAAIVTFIYGLVIASGMFRSMGRPVTALSTLTCPASQFEGFMLRWLIAVPLFLLWAYVSALIADVASWVCCSICDKEMVWIDWKSIFEITGYEWDSFDRFDSMVLSFMSNFLFIQSFFLLCGIVWSRNHALKTFGALFVIWSVYMVCLLSVAALFINGQYFFNKTLPLGLLGMIGRIAGTLFNYLLTYMRFREAEVINRW